MPTVKDVLEGKPIRAPLHPALVHLPIALLPISLLLDIASWIFLGDHLYLVRGAWIALIGGIATGLFAAIFGLVDYSEIRVDLRAKKTARLHMILNVVALILFALSAVLRRQSLELSHTKLLPLLVSVIAVGLLSYSGYLGGHLVYSDGVGVGRHRRKTPLPHSTLVVQDGAERMIPVTEASALREGETLRVDVAGTIVVVARVDGRVYAFQEFCTHRYGPLSEGTLRNGEVTCPWHCSTFDVRTGRVTAGPAKVDLRTFKVEIKGGQIWLEKPSPMAPDSL